MRPAQALSIASVVSKLSTLEARVGGGGGGGGGISLGRADTHQLHEQLEGSKEERRPRAPHPAPRAPRPARAHIMS